MAEEKRVKLGVDVGALSNELLQVNKLVEDNYQKAIKGQNEYNKVLKESLELLEEQTKFLEQMSSNGGQNQLIPSMPIMPMQGMGDSSNSILSDIKDILDEIADYFLGGSRGNVKSNTPVDNQKSNTDDQGNTVVTSYENHPNSIGAAGYINSAAAAINSNPNGVMLGLAAMIPVVGIGVSKVIGTVLEAAERRDAARHNFRAITGRSIDLRNDNDTYSNIGLSNADAFNKLASYYRSNINVSASDLYFEKGFGLNSGILGSLLSSTRQDVDIAQGASILGAGFLKSLQTGGLIDQKSLRGYSEEYLKILVDLNQKQLAVTGETNSVLNTNIVTKIASLDQHFGDPTMLANMMQGFQKGFSSAGTPQMEALQYYAMKQANPEASLWKMQMIKENPFGEEAQGYAGQFLNLLSRTGSNDDFKFNLMNQFGWTAHQTEYFVNGINNARSKKEFQDESGNFDFGKYFASMQGDVDFKAAGELIGSSASFATSETQRLKAEQEDTLATIGEPVMKLMNKVSGKVDEGVDLFTKFVNGETALNEVITKGTDYLKEIAEAYKENKEKNEQIAKEVEEAAQESFAKGGFMNVLKGMMQMFAAANMRDPLMGM